MTFKESIESRLSFQHELILNYATNTHEGALQKRPQNDKWSAFEHFAHLVRYQNAFRSRIGAILLSNQPILPRYSAEQDPKFPTFVNADTEWLTDVLVNDRMAIYNQFLEMPDQQLERIGIHPKYGKLTLMQWYEFFLLHETHHIYAMFRLVHGGR